MKRVEWQAPLANRCILLVEDEALVALELQLALTDAGAKVLLAMSIPEALRQAEYDNLAGGILDVRVGAWEVFDVATRLAQRRVPFLFHTGHDCDRLLHLWPGSPVLRKPVSPVRIVADLVELLRAP